MVWYFFSWIRALSSCLLHSTMNNADIILKRRFFSKYVKLTSHYGYSPTNKYIKTFSRFWKI